MGALLLAVYSVGLSLPFLAVALFYSQAARVIARIALLTRGIEILAGVLLIFVGLLFVTDRMTVFIGASYRALDFLNYDTPLPLLLISVAAGGDVGGTHTPKTDRQWGPLRICECKS